MSYAYIPTRDDLEKIVQKAVDESLPTAIRKATIDRWLTTSEVMEIHGNSRPHIQHLRNLGRLSYRQGIHPYEIDEVEAYPKRREVNSQ